MNSITKSFVIKNDDRTAASIYESYRNSDQKNLITLCRPFAVISAKTYSAAITLPIGIAYVAAVLEKANYRVNIIDAIGSDLLNIVRSECRTYNMQGLNNKSIINKIQPETKYFGISLMFSQEWVPHKKLIKEVKNTFPEIIIIAGGEHPTALTEFVLRDCPEIDYVIKGEGEYVMLELIGSLSRGIKNIEIPGVSFINFNNEFIDGGLSKRISHIDEIPRPAWNLFDIEPYFSGNWTMGISMGRNMPILGTRGCPYQCTFCSNPTMWTTRYSMRNVDLVVDEIQWLISEYRIDTIEFYDLTAIVKREWILLFCMELKRRNININWQLPSGTRSEALDDDTLQAIYDAGCKLLVYAPESGSEKTLKQIKKKLKLNRLNESVQTALNIGHTIKINLIIGFPEEKIGDIFKTILYGIKMAWIGVHDCNFAVFTPYPGSELYRDLLNENKIMLPSDEYFKSLLVQFDLTVSISYCKSLSGRSLSFLRITALSVFYLVSYLRHPLRIIKLSRLFDKAKFIPTSVFEQRVFDLWMRRKLQKEKI